MHYSNKKRNVEKVIVNTFGQGRAHFDMINLDRTRELVSFQLAKNTKGTAELRRLNRLFKQTDKVHSILREALNHTIHVADKGKTQYIYMNHKISLIDPSSAFEVIAKSNYDSVTNDVLRYMVVAILMKAKNTVILSDMSIFKSTNGWSDDQFASQEKVASLSDITSALNMMYFYEMLIEFEREINIEIGPDSKLEDLGNIIPTIRLKNTPIDDVRRKIENNDYLLAMARTYALGNEDIHDEFSTSFDPLGSFSIYANFFLEWRHLYLELLKPSSIDVDINGNPKMIGWSKKSLFTLKDTATVHKLTSFNTYKGGLTKKDDSLVKIMEAFFLDVNRCPYIDVIDINTFLKYFDFYLAQTPSAGTTISRNNDTIKTHIASRVTTMCGTLGNFLDVNLDLKNNIHLDAVKALGITDQSGSVYDTIRLDCMNGIAVGLLARSISTTNHMNVCKMEAYTELMGRSTQGYADLLPYDDTPEVSALNDVFRNMFDIDIDQSIYDANLVEDGPARLYLLSKRDITVLAMLYADVSFDNYTYRYKPELLTDRSVHWKLSQFGDNIKNDNSIETYDYNLPMLEAVRNVAEKAYISPSSMMLTPRAQTKAIIPIHMLDLPNELVQNLVDEDDRLIMTTENMLPTMLGWNTDGLIYRPFTHIARYLRFAFLNNFILLKAEDSDASNATGKKTLTTAADIVNNIKRSFGLGWYQFICAKTVQNSYPSNIANMIWYNHTFHIDDDLSKYQRNLCHYDLKKIYFDILIEIFTAGVHLQLSLNDNEYREQYATAETTYTYHLKEV